MNDNLINAIERLENSKKYWLEKLSGEINRLELDMEFTLTNDNIKAVLRKTIPAEISEKLIAISKNQDIASYVILLAAFKILLYKYTSQNDIITASPPLKSGGQSFNRAIAIRDIVDDEENFKEFLIKVRKSVADGYKNQYYPMDKLTKLLGYDGIETITSVIVSMDSLHNIGEEEKQILQNNNYIIVSFDKNQGCFECCIEYNSKRILQSSIEKMLECYVNVLYATLLNTEVKLKDIELISSDERELLLSKFNDTYAQYPQDLTIYELFEAQAAKTPDNIAVSCVVDLTDVYIDLRSEDTEQNVINRINECCFEENPYVYKHNIEVKGSEEEYVLLKSHTHKNIVVNKNTLKVLQLLDRNISVGSIFDKLKKTEIKFVIYTIQHDDVLEISLNIDSNKLKVFNSNIQEEFICFVKLLYNNDIIMLNNYKSKNAVEVSISKETFNLNENVPDKENLDKIFLPDENLEKAEVLLFGDTPGMSTVGLLYLASYLIRNGYSSYCQFTDSNVDYDAFEKNIKHLIDVIQPRIIGVSMKWFVHASRALEICKIVRKYNPEIKIVVGGNTASYYYNKIIEYSCVDYVIRGDGELPFLRICEDAEYIPNCIYKKDGKIIDNPITYVQDETSSQDIYISHFKEILISKSATLFGTFYIYTSKGCGLNCLNCASCREGMSKTFNRKKLNMRGIDEIRNDVLITKEYVSTFMFDFESSNEKLLDLCKSMWEGIDLSSHFCTFCNVIPPSKQLLEYVNKTFKYVYWELDICSLSERHRKYLQELGEVKPQPTDKEILDFMDQCEVYENSEVRINLIAGMPFYTEEDMKESDRMLQYIMNTYSCFSNLHWARLHAQPGAPVAHNADKYDMVSYASTFEEFIKFSDMNMDSRPGYPHLEDLFYPYVYYKDEELNSRVSRHYLETNNILENHRQDKKDNLLIVASLTYNELDKRSNQVARYLSENGVGPDSIVGLMAKYSLDLIVGILGILKSGGAYLTIDSDYPVERVRFILENSGASILLKQEEVAKNVEFSGKTVDINNEEILSKDGCKIGKTSSARNLAYIIYTSGSTGVPKGVMIEHRSLVNFIYWRINKYGFTEEDCTLQLISPVFDGFNTNFYSSMLSGGTLILPDGGHWRDFNFARCLIREMKVTNMSVVPSMYRAILESAVQKDLESLKFVVLAAEKTEKELVERSEGLNSAIMLINEYGPTENTITTASLMGMKINNTSVIGKPVANNRIYILNKKGSLLPVGVAGELCISGEGLARGYINSEELNKEKFVNNSFDEGLMYKTGDLAKWLPDGNIEFLGRIDNQVKIRGYRVELGEIENRLLDHEFVNEAAVILREDQYGNRIICAYVVTRESVEEEKLREYLMEYLPDYMVPSAFVFLDSMPLNNNGKLDRNKLKMLKTEVLQKDEYEAPRNEIEEKILAVWQEILGSDKIGINNNFFTSGGDSIKAIQISAKLQKQMIKVEVKDIFQYAKIKELSSHAKYMNVVKTKREVVQGKVSLSPIQKWFFEKEMHDRNHFNQSAMLYAKEGFDEAVIRNTFTKLVMQHDALRMVYRFVNGEVEQYNRGLDEKLFDMEVFDFTSVGEYKNSISDQAERLNRSINIENGPLVKLGLFRTKDGDHLLIIIHHLVVDGISWRIILNDFAIMYDSKIAGQDITPPDKSLPFKDWVEELKAYASSKKLLRENSYWRTVEECDTPLLPRDMQAKSNKLKNENTLYFELEDSETQNLLKGANKAYNTEINDIFLTALGMSIKNWTGLDKISVSLEGHGREEIVSDVDISDTVGWFTSEYPVIIDMTGKTDIPTRVKTVKEMLRRIPNKGIGYGILKYMTDAQDIDKKHFKMKPEIGFNYLGQFDQDNKSRHFTFSELSTGTPVCLELERPHTLEIIGMVVNGRLSITIKYCNEEYKEDTINRFSEAFKESLKAIITNCMDVQIPEYTPSDFGDLTLTMAELENIKKTVGEGISKIYPLSPMQEGMLYHALTVSGSDRYLEQTIMSITGDLDIDVYEKSYNMLFARYEILRTVFVYKGINKPRQVVLKECMHEIYFEDISSLEKNEVDDYIELFKLKDRERGFDLTRDALVRSSIIKTGEGSFKIIWDFHHIIMDGWCLGVVLNEFFVIYNSIKYGRELALESVQPYSNYINWIQDQDKEEAISYWKSSLQNYEQRATLPRLNKERKKDQYTRGEVSFTLNEGVTKRLSEIAMMHEATLSTVLQCLWGVMLQRYNNVNDVVFGTVVAGRPSEIPGIERMAGLFINTIPVRIKCDGETEFNRLIKQVQQNMISSEKYHYSPLADIQSITDLKRELIDNLMAFENYPIKKDDESQRTIHDAGFSIDDVQMVDQANYDFNIVIGPEKELFVRFIFNAEAYDTELIKSIEGHIKTAVKSITDNPSVKVKDIPVLTDVEFDTIMSINNTEQGYDKSKTIQEIFEEQVRMFQENNAVIYKDRTITYTELNKTGNKLAWYLIGKNVGKDSIIAIMTETSIETVTGIVGIIKSGAAFLPIDPAYPQKRIKFMLDDSGAKILITQRDLSCKLNIAEYFHGEIIYTDFIEDIDIDSGNPEPAGTSEDLAYVIYTSGSTGVPKGVMLHHQGILSLTKFFRDRFEVTEVDKIIQFASISFDASVWEICMALLNGAELYIVPKDIISSNDDFADFINKNEITIATLPPTYLANLKSESIKTLRKLIVAGSATPISLLKSWKDKVEYINAYGPTETTICATTWSSKSDSLCSFSVPIGKPIYNTKAFILNKYQKLQPILAPGELCISGDNLARGYLNSPEQTAEKFIVNPFDSKEKMYRTGDIARLLPDGNIEFIGRIDNQVKLRGFRIELGEIENQILKMDDVKEAYVMIDGEEDRKYICAYYTAENSLKDEVIRNYLSQRLPDYMIPNYFIQLEKLPVTINGKVDIGSLPVQSIRTGSADLMPGTNLEEEIASVWSDILRLKQVGLNDNFFEIGGNSLLLMKMYGRLSEIYKNKLKVTDIFNNPTISKLAAFIENGLINEIYEANALTSKKLAMPQQYFTKDRTSRGSQVIRARINDTMLQMIQQISYKENMDVIEVLFGMYTYFLSQIVENKKIDLQVVFGDGEEIIPVSVDFESVHELSDMLKMVKNQYLKGIEDSFSPVITGTKNEDTEYRCITLFYNTKNSSIGKYVTDVCDFSLGVSVEAQVVDLAFRYDTGKFKKEKIQKLFEQYISLIKLLTKKYQL